MRVGLLGPLEISRDGQPVVVGGGRLRALLARLALDAGRPVTTGALVEAVWEDDLPADEHHALQSLVSRLRRGLGDPKLVAQARATDVDGPPAVVDLQRSEEAHAHPPNSRRWAGAHRRAAVFRRIPLGLHAYVRASRYFSPP